MTSSHPRFHLAVPVDDLEAARTFYGGTLGCAEGRSSSSWVDFDLFGHQLVAHLVDGSSVAGPAPAPATGHVDGVAVPIPHFGVLLDAEQFHTLVERATAAGVEFIIEPQLRYPGAAGEQWTAFFQDPAGNAARVQVVHRRPRRLRPVTSAAVPGPPRDFVGYGRFPPRRTWPGGATVACNVVIVYEEGSELSMPEGDGLNEGWGEYDVLVPPPLRDLGTETHFEYGSRAGIWRLARIIDRAAAPVTVSATAVALARNPEVGRWILDGGHDVLGHGDRWVPVQDMSRAEEAAALRSAIAGYLDVLGHRPIGWNTRSFPSVHTRELLVEEGGFVYDSDPCNDDVPYVVTCLGRELLVVPYSKTLNDSRYLVAPGFSSPSDYVESVAMALRMLVRDGADDGVGRMMTVAFHARWSGQPARAAALEEILALVQAEPAAVLMRRDDIARWWLAG